MPNMEMTKLCARVLESEFESKSESGLSTGPCYSS